MNRNNKYRMPPFRASSSSFNKVKSPQNDTITLYPLYQKKIYDNMPALTIQSAIRIEVLRMWKMNRMLHRLEEIDQINLSEKKNTNLEYKHRYAEHRKASLTQSIDINVMSAFRRQNPPYLMLKWQLWTEQQFIHHIIFSRFLCGRWK